MDKLNIKFCCFLITLNYCLINISFVQGIVMRFTNITCETTDRTFVEVEYCNLRQVNQLTNIVNVRYALFRPIQKEFFYQFKFMIRNNGWQPFLYAIEIDLCRFWKRRYNALAKLLHGFLEGHTNLNHSCPYKNEKFLTFDNISNTGISKKLRGLPLGKGHYAAFTRWSVKNTTIALSNIYFEVLSD